MRSFENSWKNQALNKDDKALIGFLTELQMFKSLKHPLLYKYLHLNKFEHVCTYTQDFHKQWNSIWYTVRTKKNDRVFANKVTQIIQTILLSGSHFCLVTDYDDILWGKKCHGTA